MTQLRKKCCPNCGFDLDPISNYFDTLLRGIGHRGSSFTDVDACSHDEPTDRWLFQEFKGPNEKLNRGQARHLKALSRKEYLSVWCVRRRSDGFLDWYDVASRRLAVISEQEYQELFQRWWSNEPSVPDVAHAHPKVPSQAAPTAAITHVDLNWDSTR